MGPLTSSLVPNVRIRYERLVQRVPLTLQAFGVRSSPNSWLILVLGVSVTWRLGVVASSEWWSPTRMQRRVRLSRLYEVSLAAK